MKRRLISLFATVVMIFSALPVLPASAAYSGTCGDNLTWTLDDAGTLTISGTGAMTNWVSYLSVPWYSYRSDIKKVSIADGVNRIGSCSFYDCSSLKSVTIPEMFHAY